MHFTSLHLLGLLWQVLPVIGAKTSKYGTVTQSQTGGVLDVVIFNNSTNLNLWDNRVQSDLYDLVTQLQHDKAGVKAVVFRSGNPEFFIGLLELVDRPGEPTFSATDPRNTNNAFALAYNISQLPMTTIAAIDGRAHGVGNEFLVSLDMRFATTSSTFGQIEITAGVIPGGGGAQNLARLVGRGRAMEYVLSGMDITGEEADRIGWINRAFITAAEMDAYVDQLAHRIALFPLAGITAARETINAAGVPSLQQLDQEFQHYNTLLSSSDAQHLVGNLLELSQNETSVPFFLDLGKNILEIYGKQPSRN